jgi:uncharacterized protein (TIGR02118 family)
VATLTVLYPNTEGSTFDYDYYMNSHIPLFVSVAGEYVSGVSVTKGADFLGQDAPYLLVTHAELSDEAAFLAAFAAAADRIMADIPNFTNTTPTIQLGAAL